MTVWSSCSGLLVRDGSGSSGTIRSNWGGCYTNGMNCYWSFSSSARMQLIFTRFNTESNYDYVSVYDGDSTSSQQIGYFSGSSIPSPIHSTSDKLYVRFTSDGSVTTSGFIARYSGMFFPQRVTECPLWFVKSYPMMLNATRSTTELLTSLKRFLDLIVCTYLLLNIHWKTKIKVWQHYSPQSWQ